MLHQPLHPHPRQDGQVFPGTAVVEAQEAALGRRQETFPHLSVRVFHQGLEHVGEPVLPGEGRSADAFGESQGADHQVRGDLPRCLPERHQAAHHLDTPLLMAGRCMAQPQKQRGQDAAGHAPPAQAHRALHRVVPPQRIQQLHQSVGGCRGQARPGRGGEDLGEARQLSAQGPQRGQLRVPGCLRQQVDEERAEALLRHGARGRGQPRFQRIIQAMRGQQAETAQQVVTGEVRREAPQVFHPPGGPVRGEGFELKVIALRAERGQAGPHERREQLHLGLGHEPRGHLQPGESVLRAPATQQPSRRCQHGRVGVDRQPSAQGQQPAEAALRAPGQEDAEPDEAGGQLGSTGLEQTMVVGQGHVGAGG